MEEFETITKQVHYDHLKEFYGLDDAFKKLNNALRLQLKKTNRGFNVIQFDKNTFWKAQPPIDIDILAYVVTTFKKTKTGEISVKLQPVSKDAATFLNSEETCIIFVGSCDIPTRTIFGIDHILYIEPVDRVIKKKK